MSDIFKYQEKLTKAIKENVQKEFGDRMIIIQFSSEEANKMIRQEKSNLQFIKLHNLPSEDHVIDILELYIESSIHKSQSTTPFGGG